MLFANLEQRSTYLFEVNEDNKKMVLDLCKRYNNEAKIVNHSRLGTVVIVDLGQTYGEFLTKVLKNLNQDKAQQ